MNSVNKKNIIIVTYLFLIVITFYLFSFNIVGAEYKTLEVNYPTSQNGFRLTNTDTPLPEFLKYIFDIGFFIGFVAAVFNMIIAGVFYLMSGLKPDLLSSAKDRITGSISGIIIQLLVYLIITTINPQLAFLKATSPDTIPDPNAPKNPGVYFYKSNNCTGVFRTDNSNVENFGDQFNNQIKSAQIISGPDQEFVSTVYESPGLFGRCLDIDPNTNGCQQIESIGNSASIHQFNNKPNGDGVYIYRKPFYNTAGGWVKISNDQIGARVFGKKLQDIIFNGYYQDCNVPTAEQTCTKWDDKGNCVQKDCPNLSGKEISSIKIVGNYVVFLVYLDPSDTTTWSYCQEFPTINDMNKEGPKQIKWEKVTNQKNIPNWIYIYPVKSK